MHWESPGAQVLGASFTQAFVLFFVVYVYIKRHKGRTKALEILRLWFLLLLFSFAIELVWPSQYHPFLYLFLVGHHASLLLFVLLSFFFLEKQKKTILAWLTYVFFGLLFYLSDKMIVLSFLFIWLRPKRLQSKIQISFAFLFIILFSEIILFSLSDVLRPQASLQILFLKLASSSFSQLGHLVLHYVYDFAKILLYDGNKVYIFAFALGLIQQIFFRDPKQIFPNLALLFFIHFAFLVFVGRFLYPHPFPIRYLTLPLCLFSLEFVSHGKALRSTNHIRFSITALLWTFLFLLSLSFLRDRDHYLDFQSERVKQILTYLENQRKPILSNYETSQKIRFYSDGRISAESIGVDGKAYNWIGRREDKSLPESPEEREARKWIPNSLTKDF